MVRRTAIWLTLGVLGLAFALVSREPGELAKQTRGFRRPAENGWIFVHLEGTPGEIGFQHGSLLAREIDDARQVLALELERDTGKDWAWFRQAAENDFWPHVEAEYRQEIEGIAKGLRAKGVKMDAWDVVAMNFWLEVSNYVRWRGNSRTPPQPEHCSAFVATGSYTKDGRAVMGHNAWTAYLDGERWTIVFDVVPAAGNRFLMDGFPGLIHSGDDFGINAAGLMITETTISNFSGWDPNGIPEFVRARKAMQYAASIDDFARIMKEGNNGGYANNWLIADTRANEIASLELGLKNVTLRRTRDGYFAGSNFVVNEKMAREETDFPMGDPSNGANARHARWDQLMKEYRGRIDAAAGQRFLADHYDTYDKKEQPGERTLCGHIDLSPRGVKTWQPEFAPAGAVQNKVADAEMAGRLSMSAAAGHACGLHFKAAAHLKQYPDFEWQRPLLRDMDARPWTVFTAAK
jgi:hypothetical protein